MSITDKELPLELLKKALTDVILFQVEPDHQSMVSSYLNK